MSIDRIEPDRISINFTIMESLSPECTPLKHKYDSCFNAWFEGYLQPAISYANSTGTTPASNGSSTATPTSSSESGSGPTPSSSSGHHHHRHPIKERLFSLVPYDPESEEPEPEIEVEDDIEEEEEEEAEPEEAEPAAVVLSVQDRAKAKADEYERNCGEVWREYRACLQKSIDANQPLAALLEQARQDNPLEKAEPLDGGGLGAPYAEP